MPKLLAHIELNPEAEQGFNLLKEHLHDQKRNAQGSHTEIVVTDSEVVRSALVRAMSTIK